MSVFVVVAMATLLPAICTANTSSSAFEILLVARLPTELVTFSLLSLDKILPIYQCLAENHDITQM